MASPLASQWRYDGAGRLQVIPGQVSSLAYNARGQVTVVSYANGVATTNVYQNNRGWLMGVFTTRDSSYLQALNYGRAPTGRISIVNDPFRPEATFTYTYETLDRLLTATNGAGTLRQSFAYDAAHNLVANSQIGFYAYPSQGRITRT